MKAAMTFLLLSAVLLTAAMLCRPGWLASGSRSEPPAAQPWEEFALSPDTRIALLVRRKADKEEVARRLFAGEMTLLESAERFYHINGGPAGRQDVSLKVVPGRDDGERLCNQAISWVAAVMPTSRPRAEVQARVAVLRRELQDHVARHGEIRLPSAEVGVASGGDGAVKD